MSRSVAGQLACCMKRRLRVSLVPHSLNKWEPMAYRSINTGFAVAFSVLAMTHALAQSAYVCTGQDKIGFIFDSAAQKWRGNIFGSGHKYILQKNAGSWEFSEIGGAGPIVTCNEEEVVGGLFYCKGPYQLIFRPETSRFQLYHEGYSYNNNLAVHTPDDGTEPFIEIGLCKGL